MRLINHINRSLFFLTTIIILLLFFNQITFCQEICNNGIDDDGDGLIDCLDATCSPFATIIQNGDFEQTDPDCDPENNFGNFNNEILFWDNAAGTAELFIDIPGCSMQPSDFAPNQGVNIPASSGNNYAGFHGEHNANDAIVQEVVIQDLANNIEQGVTYTLSYDIVQMITYSSLGWEGNDVGIFQIFGIRDDIDQATIDYTNCLSIENSNGVDLLGESENITDSLVWHPQTTTFNALSNYDRILFAVCGDVYMGLDNVSIDQAIVISSDPICPQDTTVVKILNIGKNITWQVEGAKSFQPMGDFNDSIQVIANNNDISVTFSVEGFECDSTIIIPILNLQNASAGEDVSICNGGSVELNATGGTSYNWREDISTLSSTTIPNPVASPIEETDYIVEITNGSCSIVDTVTVSIGPFSSTITPDTSICLGQSVQLLSEGGDIYEWITGMATLSRTNIANPLATPSETTTYTVIVEKDGCKDTASVEIAIANSTFISVSPDETICLGESAILTASGAGVGGSYDWSTGIIDGLSATNIVNPTASPTTTTTYTVIGTTEAGCSGDTTITITVNPLPNVVIIASDTVICRGNSITLQGDGATTYIWSSGVQNNTAFTPTETQTYQVIGTDTNGCKDTTEIKVSVVDNPTPAVSIENNAPVCEGDTLYYTIASSTNLGNTSAFNWYQTNTNGTDLLLGSDDSLTYTDVNNLSSIYLIATSSLKCVDPLNRDVTSNKITPDFILNPAPELSEGLILCRNETGELTVTDNNGVATLFEWYRVGTEEIINTGTNFSITNINQAAHYFVNASHQGCESLSDTVEVSFISLSIEAMISKDIIQEGQSVNVSVMTNGTNLLWTNNLSNEKWATRVFTHTPLQSTLYTVGVTEGTCQITDTISVMVIKPFTVPRFFSPNGDGNDDVWIIDNLSDYPNYTVKVLNRWGSTIIKWENDYEPWNGEGKTGSPLPDGTYFYVIEINDASLGIKPVSGYVNITR